MKTALSVTQLTKRYAHASGNPSGLQAKVTPDPALNGLSFEAAHGELLTVVGPSGCGKSTLLRLLAGLEEETSGEMHLDGRRLNGLPPGKRDIALMFQNYALFPHLNLRDNMAFGLRVRGMVKSNAFAEVTQAAERLGIAHLLTRMPHQVSGGERQRAALARALLRRPKLFLFDEPLSSLDAALRASLRVEIGRLHRELGATMLFVTHDQSEALTLGNRVAVLNQGILQQIADPDTLYREPTNRFVAGFIGNPGMNFFEGEITRENLGEANGDPAWFFHHPDLSAPLVLPLSLTAKLGGLKPGPVTLGLRPEALSPTPLSPLATTLSPIPVPESTDSKWPSDCRLRGKLNLVERHGGSFTAYLQGSSASFIAKVDGLPGQREIRMPEMGEEMTLWPMVSQIRLFNTDTGISLH